MLAGRLARRGAKLSAGSLAVLSSQGSASAGVPLPLITSTSRAATRFAAGQAATGVVSAKVAALAAGVLKGMLMTRLKIVMAALMVVALGAAGTRSFGLSRRTEASGPATGIDEAGPEAVESQARSEATHRDGPGADEEMKKLEGTWAITDAVEEGQRPTADMKARGLGRVVIKGDKMTILGLDNVPAMTFTFDVDPGQSPRIMGMIPLNDKDEENRNEQIRLGIYKLEGDTLTICFGTDRPESFEMKPGSKQNMLVLKWARR